MSAANWYLTLLSMQMSFGQNIKNFLGLSIHAQITVLEPFQKQTLMRESNQHKGHDQCFLLDFKLSSGFCPCDKYNIPPVPIFSFPPRNLGFCVHRIISPVEEESQKSSAGRLRTGCVLISGVRLCQTALVAVSIPEAFRC
ncbi:hypothetical protein STEG23_002888 [Scotinomys teguina]